MKKGVDATQQKEEKEYLSDDDLCFPLDFDSEEVRAAKQPFIEEDDVDALLNERQSAPNSQIPSGQPVSTPIPISIAESPKPMLYSSTLKKHDSVSTVVSSSHSTASFESGGENPLLAIIKQTENQDMTVGSPPGSHPFRKRSGGGGFY